MKKILSLVLAAAMLTTVAFAGSDVIISSGASNVATPGDALGMVASDFSDKSDVALSPSTITYRFSSEYFSVATKKFSKGSNLVKEVVFSDDSNELLINLNGDQYDLARPKSDGTKSPNLVIDKLEIKAKKDYKTENPERKVIDKGETYTYTGIKQLYVGYNIFEKELDTDTGLEDDAIVKFKDTVGDTPYETFDFDGLDISLEGRAYKGDKIYVKIDGKANTDVLKMNDNADMRFYNIKTNGFPSTTTINLTAEEDEFVYKIVDGKLVASGLKWSDDDYAWVGKIRGATSYVVSDVEMKASSVAEGGTGTANPDTGANDVVGIAAALALVSLVAAGAVSLKK